MQTVKSKPKQKPNIAREENSVSSLQWRPKWWKITNSNVPYSICVNNVRHQLKPHSLKHNKYKCNQRFSPSFNYLFKREYVLSALVSHKLIMCCHHFKAHSLDRFLFSFLINPCIVFWLTCFNCRFSFLIFRLSWVFDRDCKFHLFIMEIVHFFFHSLSTMFLNKFKFSFEKHTFTLTNFGEASTKYESFIFNHFSYAIRRRKNFILYIFFFC